MNAASLMVRIGCDAEEFSRGMSKVQREAQRGFKEMGETAAMFAERFSIEAAATIGEFVHLAAEAADAAGRVDRVFGSMSGEVKRQLEEMTGVIPESVAMMQQLAVKSDNMLQGLGFGAEKAATLSVEMVKLAGDMAAFAHVPVAEALDALDRGLAGKTKGMLQFGIAIKEQEIHQEAMRRGLVDNHRVLTQLGTAEIVEYLIQQRATRIRGEAARTADQASNSFKFLKASVEEMGVSIGKVALPPVIAMVNGMRDLAGAVEHTSTGVKQVALGGVAIAGTLPFAIGMIARFGKESISLTRALEMLNGAGAIGGLAKLPGILGGMRALPILTMAGAVGILTAGLVAAYEATKNLQDGFFGISKLTIGKREWTWGSDGNAEDEKGNHVSAAEMMADQAANDHTQSVIRAGNHLRQAQKEKEKGGPLSKDNRDALQIFKDTATDTEFGYKYAVDSGGSLVTVMKQINALHTEAAAKLAAQGGAWNDMAKAAADAVIKTQKIQALVALANGMSGHGDAKAALGGAAMNAQEVKLSVASAALGKEDALRQQEAELRMADVFDAARGAAADMGGQIRKTTNDLDLRAAMLQLADGFDASKTAAVDMGEQIRKTKNDLDLREHMLTLADGFDAAREAALQFKEGARKSWNDLALRAERLKQPATPLLDIAEGVQSYADAKAATAASLSARELAVYLRNLDGPLDFARTAAISFAEGLIASRDRFHAAVADLKNAWSSAGNIGASAMAGLQEAASQVMGSFTPAALAAQAFGKVMQGLQPVIDAVMQPLVEFGKILGIMIAPIMHPLFEALKLFGIAVALIGEVVYSVAGGLAHAIGGLIAAIGSFIKKIPFLGGIGGDIQNFGNSISTLGNSFQETAANLDTARRQLQDMKWDPYGLHGLASAANAAASAMLNVPTGYRTMLARFNATLPVAPAAPYTPTVPTTSTPGSGTTSAPGGGGSGGGGSIRGGSVDDQTPLIINLDGRAIARTTLAVLKAAAARASGNTTEWAQVQAI